MLNLFLALATSVASCPIGGSVAGHSPVGLDCPSASAHVSSAGAFADNFEWALMNCEGGNRYHCFVAHVGQLYQIQFLGTCGQQNAGFCDATFSTNTGLESEVHFDVEVPDGYFVNHAQLVPTLSPAQAYPVTCSGSGCPSSTHSITSWTAIPTLTYCFNEPGGGM